MKPEKTRAPPMKKAYIHNFSTKIKERGTMKTTIDSKHFTLRAVAMLLMIVTLASVFVISSSAATGWPSVSSSAYCEFTASKTIYAYRNTACTTRGTVSPAKSYNAYIDPGDVCRIIEFSSSYIKLQYPTSSGYKTAYIKRSDLFGVSSPTEAVTSKGKVTTYTKAGGSSYGYVASGDKVYACGTSGSYTAVIYQAKSGSRAYKLGYVPTSNYNSVIKSKVTTKSLSNALYDVSSTASYITCGFNGYVNTKGKHEGIDFKRGNGYSVYSLTSGVITRITEGYRGSNGLSTIAIYDSATDKTVVYLHSDPLDSLYVGQTISVGQKIAVEDWRGCSSSSGGHTHVEMRNGRKTAAAKSVNDYTLDNPNPTSFWQSKGYTVK